MIDMMKFLSTWSRKEENHSYQNDQNAVTSAQLYVFLTDGNNHDEVFMNLRNYIKRKIVVLEIIKMLSRRRHNSMTADFLF